MDQKLKQAYKNEAVYQTNILKRLQKWLRNSMISSSLGVVFIIYGSYIHPALKILGYIITIISVLACIIIGLGLRNGQNNVSKIIDKISH